MTYYKRPVVVRPRGGRKPVLRGFGGFFDDLFGSVQTFSDGVSTTDLEKLCPPSAQTMTWRQKVLELQATWNPSGTYTSDQLRQIVGALMDAVNAQHNTVMQARAVYNTDALAKAEEAYNAIGKQAVDYTQAWQAARAAGGGGAAVSAPGLKQWVVDTMNAIVGGMRAAEIAACTKPWWLDSLVTFQRYFDVAWNTAKAIVGVAVQLGSKVIDAVEAPLSVLGWLGKYPYVPVGIAAILLFKKFGVKLGR